MSTKCSQNPLEDLMSPRMFKALGDPNRMALLCHLATCCDAKTVSDIAAVLPIDLSVVSRHLAALRDAGVLASEKRGKSVYYRVLYRQLARRLRDIADAIEACCPTDAPCHIPNATPNPRLKPASERRDAAARSTKENPDA